MAQRSRALQKVHPSSLDPPNAVPGSRKLRANGKSPLVSFLPPSRRTRNPHPPSSAPLAAPRFSLFLGFYHSSVLVIDFASPRPDDRNRIAIRLHLFILLFSSHTLNRVWPAIYRSTATRFARTVALCRVDVETVSAFRQTYPPDAPFAANF